MLGQTNWAEKGAIWISLVGLLMHIFLTKVWKFSKPKNFILSRFFASQKNLSNILDPFYFRQTAKSLLFNGILTCEYSRKQLKLQAESKQGYWYLLLIKRSESSPNQIFSFFADFFASEKKLNLILDLFINNKHQ